MKQSRSVSSSGGFTLVEIMISMVILGIMALSLAPLLLRSSHTATGAAGGTYQTAVMSTEVARLNAIKFDLLPLGTTCVTVSAQPLPHTKCTTVTSISARQRRVTVIITPSANAYVKPDTVTFDRTQALDNPLTGP
jgi:prepilin-type N-terminal cleavage/methylation domain-containing protein